MPVGEPVPIKLSSADVIHSFWVPNLDGQAGPDPGPREPASQFTRGSSRASIAANAPSSAACSTRIWPCWWSPSRRRRFDALARRADRSRRPPRRPPRRQRGQRGLPAQRLRDAATRSAAPPAARHARPRPHPSRPAARTIARRDAAEPRAASLAAWIADPQTIKPGNNMPIVPLGAGRAAAAVSPTWRA